MEFWYNGLTPKPKRERRSLSSCSRFLIGGTSQSQIEIKHRLQPRHKFTDWPGVAKRSRLKKKLSKRNEPREFFALTARMILPGTYKKPIFGELLTGAVIGTGKRGIWREKPPDAESAVWGRFLASAGKCPHLSGARGVGRWLN
jgi:hypothetical protein